MGGILAVIAALAGGSCHLTPVVENRDGAWTPDDTLVYTSVIENGRCKVHFGDSAPCLKRFVKKGKDNYYAICTTGQAPKSGTAGVGRSSWFAITVLEDKKQRDYVPSGSTSKVNGCGTTCPTRRKDKRGGR